MGIIDTGIDYLHTNFGGPGTGYDANNTTIVGDAPNYRVPRSLGATILLEMTMMPVGNRVAPFLNPILTPWIAMDMAPT